MVLLSGVRRRRRTRAAAVAATCSFVAVALACGHDDATAPRGAPGFEIVSGGGRADTVLADFDSPLVVRVRGSDGRPASGVVVQFTPLRLPDEFGTPRPTLFVWRNESPCCVPTDTADAFGRASASVALGSVAGLQGVVVTAPALGLVDTVPFTARPGAPVGVRAFPADTALYVGHAFASRAAVVDSYGNPRGEPVTLSALTPAIVIAPNGAGVVGVAVGRGLYTVRSGEWTATGWVSVVPEGTIAAHASGRLGDDTTGVVVVNLEGSGYRHVIATGFTFGNGGDTRPRWDRAGARLAYHQWYEGFANTRVYTVDLSAAQPSGLLSGTRLLPDSPFRSESDPDFSPDGAWVYFLTDRFWRAHLDGGALEELPSAGEPDFVEVLPAVSPDGQSLAYSGSYYGYLHPRVRVRTIAAGQRTALDAPGTAPRWSPTGEWLAYLEIGDDGGYVGRVHVVRPDGTEDHVVAPDALVGPGVDWSPDGRYLVAESRDYGPLWLVDVASGTVLPLPYAYGLTEPAWRPVAAP